MELTLSIYWPSSLFWTSFGGLWVPLSLSLSLSLSLHHKTVKILSPPVLFSLIHPGSAGLELLCHELSSPQTIFLILSSKGCLSFLLNPFELAVPLLCRDKNQERFYETIAFNFALDSDER